MDNFQYDWHEYEEEVQDLPTSKVMPFLKSAVDSCKEVSFLARAILLMRLTDVRYD